MQDRTAVGKLVLVLSYTHTQNSSIQSHTSIVEVTGGQDWDTRRSHPSDRQQSLTLVADAGSRIRVEEVIREQEKETEEET